MDRRRKAKIIAWIQIMGELLMTNLDS